MIKKSGYCKQWRQENEQRDKVKTQTKQFLDIFVVREDIQCHKCEANILERKLNFPVIDIVVIENDCFNLRAYDKEKCRNSLKILGPFIFSIKENKSINISTSKNLRKRTGEKEN